MSDHTPDALASALPDGVRLLYGADVVDQLVTHQAAKLAEAGYVLVHTAPDEATVERLADVAHRHDRTRYQGCGECRRIFVEGTAGEHAVHQTRKVLAALADTSPEVSE